MIFSLFFGAVFGTVVGGIMRLPGKETLLDANAANLCVMITLWLGALLTGGTPRGAVIREVVVALFSFVCAAAAFQGYAGFLYVGFIIQTVWSLAHVRGQLGVKVIRNYPAFSAAANVLFAVTYLVMERMT